MLTWNIRIQSSKLQLFIDKIDIVHKPIVHNFALEYIIEAAV